MRITHAPPFISDAPTEQRVGAPAQALVGGLLVQRHGVHELQARALVGAPQQRAAVAVDQPHPLQRAEEPLPNLLLLWFAVPVDRSTQM